MTPPILPLWKDYEFEIDVERKALANGNYVPAPGLTLTVYVETSIGGGSIDDSLAGTMSERTGRKARMYFAFDCAALTAQLGPHDDTDVYIVVVKDGDIIAERFKRRVQLASTG